MPSIHRAHNELRRSLHILAFLFSNEMPFNPANEVISWCEVGRMIQTREGSHPISNSTNLGYARTDCGPLQVEHGQVR